MRADEVAIEAPCHQDWDRMRPEAGGQRRFCEHCQLHVHDLSRMSEPAARAFLRETANRDVCIAYLEDERGELSFNPNSAASRPARFAGGPTGRSDLDLRFNPEPRIVPLARLASAATVAMLLGACTPHGEPERAMQVEVPESPATLAPSSVIPCNTATPNDLAHEAAEALGTVREAREMPIKGKRKRTMGRPPMRDDLDGL